MADPDVYSNDSWLNFSSLHQPDRCWHFELVLANFSDLFHKYPPLLRPATIAAYAALSTFGAAGNLLVVGAVLRNRRMRIPRNYFVINLALSDFLLCSVTTPFSAYANLNALWGLGTTLCRLIAMFQAVNTFVSTITITAIGMDRYWAIVFPARVAQQSLVASVCFLVIWTVSVALSVPLFYATRLKRSTMCGARIAVCMEDWDEAALPFSQLAYSLSCTLLQYLLPLGTLIFLYGRIIGRLKKRLVLANRNVNRTLNTSRPRLRPRPRSGEARRRSRRTNALLVAIVVAFAASWLPLNAFNALVALRVVQYEVAAFVACHMAGVLSACANPILYGVFNDNFRAEFRDMLAAAIRWRRVSTTSNRTSTGPGISMAARSAAPASGNRLLQPPLLPLRNGRPDTASTTVKRYDDKDEYRDVHL